MNPTLKESDMLLKVAQHRKEGESFACPLRTADSLCGACDWMEITCPAQTRQSFGYIDFDVPEECPLRDEYVTVSL